MEIEFYATRDGKDPVKSYLAELSPKQQAKIAWTFRVIQNIHPIPAQYLQKMVDTDSLWEVRVVFAGDIFRLMGFINEEQKLVLCHGFTKKTQKSPQQEIATATARKNEYENRKK